MPHLRLYAAGSNSHGQLGIDSLEDAHSFTLCSLDLPITADMDTRIKIAAGANHTLLLLRLDGKQSLYASGSSRQGQLGSINEELHFHFTSVDLQQILLEAGQIAIGAEAAGTVHDVASGWETSLIATRSQVICLGKQSGAAAEQSCVVEMQVPLDAIDSIRSISAGPSHSMVVTTCRKSYGWGAGRHGQLGTQNTAGMATRPVQTNEDDNNRAVTSAVVGHQHTVLVLENPGIAEKEILLLGSNRKGQLGAKDPKARSNLLSRSDMMEAFPQVHAAWNTTYIQTHDSLLSFGNNAHGQLGRDGSELGDMGRVDLPNKYRIVQVAAGSEHVLAILESPAGEAEVWGWGWNEHGNLGSLDGDLTDVKRPRRIWQPASPDEQIMSVHAGNGTSWIATIGET